MQHSVFTGKQSLKCNHLVIGLHRFQIPRDPVQILTRFFQCDLRRKKNIDDLSLMYSLNDNIMRGAAKSLAPLPTAWMDNITGKTEVLADSLSQYYSRHRGVF